MVHAYSPSTKETEAEGSAFESEASLSSFGVQAQASLLGKSLSQQNKTIKSNKSWSGLNSNDLLGLNVYTYQGSTQEERTLGSHSQRYILNFSGGFAVFSELTASSFSPF